MESHACTELEQGLLGTSTRQDFCSLAIKRSLHLIQAQRKHFASFDATCVFNFRTELHLGSWWKR